MTVLEELIEYINNRDESNPDSNKDLEHLQKALKEIRRFNDITVPDLRAQIVTKNTDIKDLEGKYAALKVKYDEVEAKKSELEKERDDLIVLIGEVQKERDKYKTELVAWTDRFGESPDEVFAERKNKDDELKKSKKALDNNEAEIETLTSQVEKHEEEIEKLRKKVSQLEASLRNADQLDKPLLKSELDSAKGKLNEEQTNLAIANEKLRAANDQKIMLESRLEKLETDNKAKIESLEKRLEKVKEDLQTNKDKLKQAKADKDQCLSDLSKAEADLQTTSNELKLVKRERDSYERDSKDKTLRNDDYKKKLEISEKRIVNLVNSKSVLSQDKIVESIGALNFVIEWIKEERRLWDEFYNSKIEKTDKERAQYFENNQILQNKLGKYQKLLDDLKVNLLVASQVEQ